MTALIGPQKMVGRDPSGPDCQPSASAAGASSLSGIPSAEALQAQRAFLEDAANYFERRDTHGEDRAYWANVYNAKNCRDAALSLEMLEREMARRDANETRNCINWGPCSRNDHRMSEASAMIATAESRDAQGQPS